MRGGGGGRVFKVKKAAMITKYMGPCNRTPIDQLA